MTDSKYGISKLASELPQEPKKEEMLIDEEKAERKNKRDRVKDEELGKEMLKNIKDYLASAKQIIEKDENPLAPKLKLLKGFGSVKNLSQRVLDDLNFILDKLNVSQEIAVAAQNYKTELENLMAEME